MKYSYMPDKRFRNKIEFGCGWFDSDDRSMSFRNQYGEYFMFTPMAAVTLAFTVMFAFGTIVGFICGKVL